MGITSDINSDPDIDIGIDTRAIIKLQTIDNARKFVEVADTFPSDIYIITKDGGRVDGKSILGLFSIGLLDDITVEIDSENYEECMLFQEEMTAFQEKNEHMPKSKGGSKSK